MRRSRGRELPGTFNPLIVGDLFFKQSQPWQGILEESYDTISNAIQASLRHAIYVAADRTTSEGLLREVVHPALRGYSKTFGAKMTEILRPHQNGHPITCNHYLNQTI